MNLESLDTWVKIVATLSPLAAAIISALSFFWSYARVPAKKLGVVELATKRLAFRSQRLALELSVLSDVEEQLEARDHAKIAIDKIEADANRELERLVWNERVDRLNRQKLFASKRNFHSLTWFEKAEVLALRAIATYFVFAALLIFSVLIEHNYTLWSRPSQPRKYQLQLIGLTLSLLCSFLAGSYSRWASRIYFGPKPPPHEMESI